MADLSDYGRRITALERQIALTQGSRRLTDSAVGGGGIRVHDSGQITIEDTGSLVIESGDLVLGRGMIEGDALTSQIETFFASAWETGMGASSSWQTTASINFTPPGWATSMIVILITEGLLVQDIYNDEDRDWRVDVRYRFGSRIGPEKVAELRIGPLQSRDAATSYSWAELLPADGPITFDHQVRSGGRAFPPLSVSYTDMRATIICLR